MANIKISCHFLSDYWLGAGSYHCLKGTPYMISCLILSEQYDGAGSLDGLKVTPGMFSLEEKSDLAREIFFSIFGTRIT